MVQGYYTLQEAAQVLSMKVDDLKGLAQKNQIRSFQDRGTLRFRIQDIQELQRQRLGESDPEMVLGDALAQKPAASSGPKSGVKTPRPVAGAKGGEVFDFDLDESVEIGKEPLSLEGSAVRSKSGMLKSSAPKSQASKTPKQGSDSDVKLVSDGSDNFSIQLGGDLEPTVGDSDVRLGELSTNKKSGPASASRKSGIGRRGKLGQSPADSGVRLVPMDNDAPAASESDVRLSRPTGTHRASENMINTEEIDLDQEIQKAEADKKSDTIFKTNPTNVGKPGSPFELSDNDLGSPTQATDDESSQVVAAPKAGKSAKSAPPKSPKPAPKKNTEFDLVPGDSDEDFSLELDEDAINLGAEVDSEGPKSGINLSRPSDRGISLEAPKDDDSADFELDLQAPPTPKPKAKGKPAKAPSVDDSEFELSLDDLSGDDSSTDDSEFELALDDGETDSDDEFELALDDVEEEPAPKAKSKAKDKGPEKTKAKGKGRGADTEEQDLFETDFELPALDDEDSEETVDSGSSDFELALDDSDISVEDESASQVVALDEEDDVDTGETMDGEADDYDDFEEGDVEEEPEVRERVVVQEVIRDRWVRTAPWGPLPVVFMLPCVVVLVIAAIMGWELVQSSSGFQNSGILTRSIADMMSLKIR